MTSKEKEKIRDLKKCDFKEIDAYFKRKTEERKAMTKEEKLVKTVFLLLKIFYFSKQNLA